MPAVIDSLDSLKEYLASKDNSESFEYFSPIPGILSDSFCFPILSINLYLKFSEICKTEKCILGVDEAGRGKLLLLFDLIKIQC